MSSINAALVEKGLAYVLNAKRHQRYVQQKAAVTRQLKKE